MTSYQDRSDLEAAGCACTRSKTCQLVDEHAGKCDDRPERLRWRELFEALDEAESEDP